MALEFYFYCTKKGDSESLQPWCATTFKNQELENVDGRSRKNCTERKLKWADSSKLMLAASAYCD